MFRMTSCLRAAIAALGILAGTPVLAAAPASPQAGGQPPMSVPANPASGCFKPGVPLCMDDGTTFVSADKMSGCQFEVKEYVDKTMAYLKCLNDENIATGQDLTRNVERFNCRLSGRKGC
ncbi:hypothetical protein [Azospirillum agricola]|uniref:hypothetical protein n=1 Tax=Azospirillum agricola TaxID=1720247 RepID=UPI000A0F0A62|nr:hypothetical protein [Azospirillum agricola]SMH52522.1 hypothetical protein SAMN02982994_3157 [Azospirillum lipoferum]